MAFIIKVDRTVKMIEPNNGRDFSLKELQGFVGGLIEPVQIDDHITMVVNEEGYLRGMKLNYVASFIARFTVRGDAVFIKKSQLR